MLLSDMGDACRGTMHGFAALPRGRKTMHRIPTNNTHTWLVHIFQIFGNEPLMGYGYGKLVRHLSWPCSALPESQTTERQPRVQMSPVLRGKSEPTLQEWTCDWGTRIQAKGDPLSCGMICILRICMKTMNVLAFRIQVHRINTFCTNAKNKPQE